MRNSSLFRTCRASSLSKLRPNIVVTIMSAQEEQLIELMLELKVCLFSFKRPLLAFDDGSGAIENNAATSAVHPYFNATNSIRARSTHGQDECDRRAGSPGTYVRVSGSCTSCLLPRRPSSSIAGS